MRGKAGASSSQRARRWWRGAHASVLRLESVRVAGVSKWKGARGGRCRARTSASRSMRGKVGRARARRARSERGGGVCLRVEFAEGHGEGLAVQAARVRIKVEGVRGGCRRTRTFASRPMRGKVAWARQARSERGGGACLRVEVGEGEGWVPQGARFHVELTGGERWAPLC